MGVTRVFVAVPMSACAPAQAPHTNCSFKLHKRHTLSLFIWVLVVADNSLSTVSSFTLGSSTALSYRGHVRRCHHIENPLLDAIVERERQSGIRDCAWYDVHAGPCARHSEIIDSNSLGIGVDAITSAHSSVPLSNEPLLIWL